MRMMHGTNGPVHPQLQSSGAFPLGLGGMARLHRGQP